MTDIEAAGEVGYYLGMHISSEFLPNLSTDLIIPSNVIIIVPLKDSLEWRQKQEQEWDEFNKHSSSQEKYISLFRSNIDWYKYNLTNKFLPKELIYKVGSNLSNTLNKMLELNFKDEVINGIDSSLIIAEGNNYDIVDIIKKDDKIEIKFKLK